MNQPLQQDIQVDSNTGEGDSFNEMPSLLRKQIMKNICGDSFFDRCNDDVYNIAKFVYGWYGENCNLSFEAISEYDLEDYLTPHDVDEFTDPDNPSLTFIVQVTTANQKKYLPLVIGYRNHGFIAYCCSHCDRFENRICRLLKETISGINIQIFDTLSDHEHVYSLLFAFENARIFNDALQSSQSIEIEQKLSSFEPTLEQIYEIHKEYVNVLSAIHCIDKVGFSETLFIIIKKICVHLVTHVLDEHSNVNSRSIVGWEPLMLAVRSGRIELVTSLIERGADINCEILNLVDHVEFVDYIMKRIVEIENHPERNQLHRYEIMNALCGNGPKQLTPLMLAVQFGYSVIASYLIKLGADIHRYAIHSIFEWYPQPFRADNLNVESFYEENLLLMAFLGEHMNVANALLNRRVNDAKKYHTLLWNVFSFAIWNYYLEIAHALIYKGVNIDYFPGLVYCVVDSGCARRLRLLLILGVKVNGDDLELLKIAVKRDHVEVMRLLIGLGATMENLRSMLLYAASLNRGTIIELLLDEGVDIDAINEDETGTALLVAIKNGSANAVRTLMGRGANLNLTIEAGYIPIMQTHFNEHGHNTRLVIHQKELLTLDVINHIGKFRLAELYTDECYSRLLKSIRCCQSTADVFHEFLEMCGMEIKKLCRENYLLYIFLKITNTHALSNIWEKVEKFFNVFDNDYLDVANRYPIYADILINKADEVRKMRKDIFLHNHKQLIDALSASYKYDLSRMRFAVLKRFVERHADDIVAVFAKTDFLLTHFMNFNAKKKTVPRLEMMAFAQVILDRSGV